MGALRLTPWTWTGRARREALGGKQKRVVRQSIQKADAERRRLCARRGCQHEVH